MKRILIIAWILLVNGLFYFVFYQKFFLSR